MGNGLCRANVPAEQKSMAAVPVGSVALRNPTTDNVLGGQEAAEVAGAVSLAAEEVTAGSAAAREQSVGQRSSTALGSSAGEAAAHVSDASDAGAEPTDAVEAACELAMAAARRTDGGEGEEGEEERRWHVLVLGAPRQGTGVRRLAARLLTHGVGRHPREGRRDVLASVLAVTSEGAEAAAETDVCPRA